MTDKQITRARAAVHTWSGSYWFVILLALIIGVTAVVASLGFDWFFHGLIRRVYASDVLEGITVAIFSGAALLKLQARRRELLVRMQVVEDVNHHVRNALTSVVLSASLREDEDLNALVKDACERIDWVLNDVLPQSIDAAELKNAHSDWTSGRQLEPTILPRPPRRSPDPTQQDHP
jgi:hypothetical protein